MLIVAAVVSLGVGGYEGWTSPAAMSVFERYKGCVEGIAILTSVLLVAVITATQNHDKEMKFQELNATNENVDIEVIRSGETKIISIHDVVVGDIVSLDTGNQVPADGLFIEGDEHSLACDESSLTGEPEEVKKGPNGDEKFIFSGSRLASGNCKMLVVAVGANSEWGRIKAGLETKSENTPLQDKLETLADQIGYLGMAFAAATFLAMVATWYYTDPASRDITLFETVLKAFIMAVTIIVVAVPEGLPLAVTLSLAYSTSKMQADNNLIRIISACETMGNATTICSDKTGTLTQNKMTVVEAWIGGKTVSSSRDGVLEITLESKLQQYINENISINSTARFVESEDNEIEVRGSKTEGALFNMLKNSFDVDFSPIREKGLDYSRGDRMYTFTSDRKRMSTLLYNGKKAGGVSYTKGASEVMLADCSHFTNASGAQVIITAADRSNLEDKIQEMAQKALRTIAIAHRVYETKSALPKAGDVTAVERNMVLDGIFGIKDPLRPDVPEAVARCQAAGILVRMVTGDNIETAKAIAKECGILTEGGISMQGPEFRVLTPAQLDAVLPNLQVLARSSPTDKHTLVTRLNGKALPENEKEWLEAHPGRNWAKEKDLLLPGYKEEWTKSRPFGGDVVGVTGDGTNDGPALKAADVGLSMGKSGTDVAKAASSIVIMDDNFSSIVKSVKWGRSVFDNIRKFLQFQLTVNIVALTVTFFAAMGGQEPPLNAVMMLWVNLIMDTMGALALGTEPPSESLLDRKPYVRNASLVSRPMIRNILFQSVYQILLLVYLLVLGAQDFGVIPGSDEHTTIIFNTFVLCQVVNEVNARSIGDEANVFKGIFKNPFFAVIIVVTIMTQYVLVEADYVRWLVRTVPLSGIPGAWYKCGVLGAISLPIGGIMRNLPVKDSKSDFAVLPEIADKLANEARKNNKAGKIVKEDNFVDILTYTLWLTCCFVIVAQALIEFGEPWLSHFKGSAFDVFGLSEMLGDAGAFMYNQFM